MDGTGCAAVEDDRAAPPQALEGMGKGRLPHAVVHDLHSCAIRHFPHTLRKVHLLVEDRLGSQLAGDFRLFRSAHVADHAGAPQLGDLGEQLPHASGSRMDEAGHARFKRKQRVREVVRGVALQHERDGNRHGHVVGNRCQPPRRNHGVFGIAPQREAVGHPVARLHVLHAVPHGLHHAPAFHAGRERGLVLVGVRVAVHALAHVDVNEVDARVAQFHQGFARSGLRQGSLAHAQDFRVAVFTNLHCSHDHIP